MTENCVSVKIPDRFAEPKQLVQKIAENVNVAVIPSTEDNVLR